MTIFHIRSGHTNDDRYHKRTDGIHDEYPSSGESSDHGDLILGHDTFDQCQDRTSVPGRDPGSRRRTDVHCKKAHPHFIKVFDEYDELNNSVQENVNAARVVKAFVREDYEVNKFHGVSKYVYTLFTKAEKIVAWNAPTMQFMMYAVVLLIAVIGGRSIVFGTMETGELTSVIVYALQILMSLNMVTFCICHDHDAEASTDRITEVLNEVPEMQDRSDAVREVPSGDIVF